METTMSETSAAVEAPQVPAESTETADTGQAPEQAPETLTVSDIKMGARKRLTEKLEAAIAAQEGTEETIADRLRHPKGSTQGGRFMRTEETTEGTEEVSEEVSPESSTPDTAEVPVPETAGASEAVEEGATGDEQATTPVGTVTVPVADNHPLRQRGREAFKVAPEDERDLRALLNSHTRRSELDQATQQMDQLSAQLLESRADAEFWRDRANNGGVFTPEQTQAYQDILNTYGEADAESYRNGILSSSVNEGLEQKKAEARQTHGQLVARQKAEKFAADAVNDALNGNPVTDVPPQYPLWNEPEVRTALSGYGSICQARNQTPTPKGWYSYANSVYGQKPEVQAKKAVDRAGRQQKVAAKVKATATATATKAARLAEEKRLLEAATRHSTRPRTFPTGASAGVRDTGTSDENEAMRKMSPGQQKRARRSRVRTWAQSAQ